MNRTDIHRPTELTTEDYSYVGGFDNNPPVWFEGPNAAGEYLRHGGMSDRDISLRNLVQAATGTCYHSAHQCDHCGAAIRYVAVIKHLPTGDHLAVGETCLDNRFGRATADFQAMRKQAQLDREQQRLVKAWNDYKDSHTAPWSALAASNNSFIMDVLRKGRQYGNLSDRQLAAIVKAYDRDMERAAEQANAVEVVKVPVPEGKVTITGKVVSLKWKSSQYGDTLKMTVVVTTPEGEYAVWGTCPTSLDCERGDIVTFSATVEAATDKVGFGFFKRPTKSSIVSTAGEEPTVAPEPAPVAPVVAPVVQAAAVIDPATKAAAILDLFNSAKGVQS
jgi:hypothetical protein